MKLSALLIALALAALVSGTARAETPTPAETANAARACHKLYTDLGEAIFRDTYGTNANRSNAFGKCVSAWTRKEHQSRNAAEAACAAEQADPGFAAAHGGKTFAQFYGAGPKGAGAMPRCINARRTAATAGDVAETENAAKKCKAERKRIGTAAFKAAHGANANGSNAFARCVVKLTTG